MKLVRSRSGIGLLVMVTLIAIGGIMITISARVFENMARQTQLRVDQTRAHYLAQAGVMRAVWNWYTSNTTIEGSRRWSPINTTAVAGTNLIFKAGMDANASYLQSNYAYVAPISHTGIALAANIGTAQSKAAGTTLVRTLTVGVTQGDLIVVTFAMDNEATGGAVTCADFRGNTYSVAEDVTYNPAGAGTGVRTVILYAIADTALIATDTITVTHPNVTARALSARSFTGATHLDATTTATGLALVGTTGNQGINKAHELIIGAIGAEGPSGDTFTAGASYTTMTDLGTTGGAANTNVTIDPEYRIVNAEAAYLANGTICTAAQSAAGRDYAVAMATFVGRAHWFTSGANRRLRAWRLQNIHNASSITLTDVKVSWTGGGAARLNDIRLNNASVWPGGTATSGTTVNVTDTALTFGSSWSGINTYLQWDNSGPADPTTVTCQFIFAAVAPATTANSDVNSDEVVMWDGVHAGSGLPKERTFKVTATGQVNQTLGKYFKVLKTVNATVSGAPGLTSMEIIDWDEGEKNIP